MRVKDKLIPRDVVEMGVEFIQNTSHVDEDDIEIKYEEVGVDYSFLNSSESEDKSNHDLNTVRVSNIPHVDCGSVNTEENDLYLDLLQCEQDCETCLANMNDLSDHVRAFHAPPQPIPIQDPLIINLHHTDTDIDLDPLQTDQFSSSLVVKCENDDSSYIFGHILNERDRDCETCVKFMRMLSEHVRVTHALDQRIKDPLLIDKSSTSIHIKSEVDEGIVKTEQCSEEEEKSKSNSNPESDPDFDVELESEHDPDYSPSSPSSSHLTRYVRRHGFPKNHKSNDSKRLRARRRTNQLRPNECSEGRGLNTNNKAHSTGHKRTHTGDRPYTCEECKKRFSQRSNLIAHQRVHTGEKPYECELCEKRFRNRSNLVHHNMTHTGERPYECDECEKRFMQSGSLIAHKRSHTGERPFKCEVCGKGFSRKDSLADHKTIHTGERPYSCEQCKMSFSWNKSLIRHQRSHTGEKPYECEHCEKSFRTSTQLVSHNRTHTGERPYKCGECEKTYSSSSHFTVHKRTHTGERPFKCEVCGKGFSAKTDLSKHNRIHIGVKAYSCPVCEMSFLTSGTLTKHKRIHTRPYKCDACDKTYSSASKFAVHNKWKHGIL